MRGIARYDPNAPKELESRINGSLEDLADNMARADKRTQKIRKEYQSRMKGWRRKIGYRSNRRGGGR